MRNNDDISVIKFDRFGKGVPWTKISNFQQRLASSIRIKHPNTTGAYEFFNDVLITNYNDDQNQVVDDLVVIVKVDRMAEPKTES